MEKLNFDAEILTSEIMQKLSIPMTTRNKNKSSKTLNDMSESRLITNVKVEDLVIDLSYQRKPNQDKVSKIIRDFDPNALGVIICSMRDNGVVAVIDGGHRISALNIMGMGQYDIRCLVFFDLTIQQEAEMFATLNDNRSKPKTVDIFKSKVIAKDSDAVAVNDILKKHGLTITAGPANNSVRAIGTINKIYKRYGKAVLNNTIECLSSAFSSHSTSFSDQALFAVSSVLNQYKDSIDKKRIIEVLKTYGNVAIWSSKGSSIAKQAGFKDMYTGMIFVFIGDYNKRLKKNRLDITEIMEK